MTTVASTTNTTPLYTNRISGLASGMDTETMVKNLVSAERARTVDPLTKQKQLLEWKRDDYRGVNTKLLALRTATFDIKMKTTFLSKTVDSTDSSVLTATSTANALNGNYSIQVKQLAQGVTKQSTAALDSSWEYSGTDETFTLTGSKGSSTITISNGNSITDVVSAINNVSDDTGIKATYDSSTKQFFLMTSDMGASSKIEITDTADSILSSVFNLDTTAASGQDAIIKFNGGSDISFSSNTVSFNNMNLTLKKEGTTSITVSNDVDAAVDKIKAFVDAYNSAMEDMSDKLSEKRDRDYAPLTDAQKEEMNDTDIANWEEKAKSGMLRGDTLLNNIYSGIRTAASNIVDGLDSKYKTLSSVGITTGEYTDKGKLYIDEDKLRAALSEDPEGVMDMFTQTSDTGAQQGIAVQLYDQLNTSIKSITSTAGQDSDYYDQSALGTQISDTSDKITTAEDRLSDYQEKYWNEFSNMEQLLEQLNNQSSWLQSMLGTSSS